MNFTSFGFVCLMIFLLYLPHYANGFNVRILSELGGDGKKFICKMPVKKQTFQVKTADFAENFFIIIKEVKINNGL